MNRIILLFSVSVLLAACNSGGDHTAGAPDALVHPEWSKNAIIYEMNVRQHSSNGSLRSAQADLARLKQLAVDVIWLMPVHPIGEVNRKGGENQNNFLVQPGSSSLGSPYSVKDYTALNTDYGSWEDFDLFLRYFGACFVNFGL